MKSQTKLTGVLAVLCGAFALSMQALFGARSGYMAANTTANYNMAVDTHKNKLSRTNDAAIATRHLLYKEGTTPGTTVAVCGAGDAPLGTIDNIEPLTGKDQAVLLFGKAWTQKMIASAALAVGARVYTAASGKVQGTPTIAGTYYYLGRVLKASGADGDVMEVETVVPQKVIVIAAATAAALTGTLTGTVNGALVDVAAAAGACAGTTTPSATNVDSAIATAVAPIVSGVNEQLKELLTMVNALTADNAALRAAIATPATLQALAA